MPACREQTHLLLVVCGHMVEALAGLPEQNVLLAEFLPQEVLGEMPSVSATRPPGKGGAGGGFGDPAASSLPLFLVPTFPGAGGTGAPRGVPEGAP